MEDCMPKEQREYIEAIKKDMLESTNMTENEAYSFAFRCWQCGYRKVGRNYESEIHAKAIEKFAEKAIHVVYEANNRERNPQPRDMVADIHYRLMEIAEHMKGEKE